MKRENLTRDVSKIWNDYPIEIRKEMRMHCLVEKVNTIRHIKQIVKRNNEKLLRELTDWENNLTKTLEEDLQDYLLAKGSNCEENLIKLNLGRKNEVLPIL
jgi:uncharacterized membrane protein